METFSLARLHFGSETRSSGAASGVHRVQELGREAELGQPEVTEVAEVIELGVDRVEERRERRERRERSKNSRSFRRSLGASLTWANVPIRASELSHCQLSKAPAEAHVAKVHGFIG